jgi:hypothetical protein
MKDKAKVEKIIHETVERYEDELFFNDPPGLLPAVQHAQKRLARVKLAVNLDGLTKLITNRVETVKYKIALKVFPLMKPGKTARECISSRTLARIVRESLKEE